MNTIKRRFTFFFLLMSLLQFSLQGQPFIDDGNLYLGVDVYGIYTYQIPAVTSLNAIEINLKGGDGGWVKTAVYGCEADGGEGATVKGTIVIGDNLTVGQLPPGTLLRFIIGESGYSQDGRIPDAAAGGGGGSAIIAQLPGESEWRLLAVAGGGGGAFRSEFLGCNSRQNGQGGLAIPNGGAGGGGGGSGGAPGQGGGAGMSGSEYTAGGGGGAFGAGAGIGESGGGSGNLPEGTGGLRGAPDYSQDLILDSENYGGYGFGAGGASINGGGGGGGYSGGGGGARQGYGGGGGSYGNTTYLKDLEITAGGTSGDGNNGYFEYQFKEFCTVTWTGPNNSLTSNFEYIEPLCNETDRATIQMLYYYTFGNACALELEWSIFQSGGDTQNYVNEGNGRWSNVAAGLHLIQVYDKESNEVLASTEIQVRPVNNIPVAKCKDVTVTLAPIEIIPPSDFIDDGSYGSECDESISFSLSKDRFRCGDVGENTVVLTVTGSNGYSSTCQSTVTVVDPVPMEAKCKPMYDFDLRGRPSVTISVSDIDDNSILSDCLGEMRTFPSTPTVTSDDVGKIREVYLFLESREGNIVSNCSTILRIVDSGAFNAACKENFTLPLDDAGQATLNPADIDNGSIVPPNWSLSVSQSEFDCLDIGNQEVSLILTDGGDNSASCTSTVQVVDNIVPVALCKDITVQLDANGLAFININDVNNGSYDDCGINLISLDQTQTTNIRCQDIGIFTVTLYMLDYSGNFASCQAAVTVQDNIEPQAICQDVTVQLDVDGNASITTADINNGSNDACGIATMSLDQTSFTCDQTGDNTVTLNVTDNNENSGNCQATVTVVDKIDPTLSCQQHMTVNTDQGECGAYVLLPKAVASDNCGLTSLRARYRPIDENEDPIGDFSAWADDHSGFFEAGSFEIQWKAGDGANSYSYCVLILDVIDEEAPAVICKDVTINFNGEETIAIPTSSIFDEGASFDACGTVSFVNQSLGEVSCDKVGETVNVQVIGIDPNGNTSSCIAQVAVVGMPCGFEATDIDCEQGAAADYDAIKDSYTLEADDCSGYPQGEFSFVGTRLCGDGEITVKVSDLVGDGRAGVVMMESTDPGARRVSMLKSQTRQVTTEYRASTNGSLFQKHKNRSGVEWVRIVRIGNKFKTYTSTNGSSWKHAHTINFSNFADCVHAGMMTYSRRSYDPVTATFDQLSVVSYSNTALAALPTGTSAAMEDVTEQSSDNYFPSNDLVLEVAPNPFSDQTQIEFTLPQATEVTLEIYNLHGQRVQSLENAQLDAGTHRYQWNGQSSKSESLPTGIYMLRLRADKKWITTKVSLVNK